MTILPAGCLQDMQKNARVLDSISILFHSILFHSIPFYFHPISFPFHNIPAKKCQSNALKMQLFHVYEEVLVYHLEGVARFNG